MAVMLIRNIFKKATCYGLLFFLFGCIKPLDIQPSDFEDFLVVEGFINDDYGPHNIRITRVARFAGIRDGGEIKIEEADVSIIDDLGNVTPLIRTRGERKVLNSIFPPCFITIAFQDFITDHQTPPDFKGEVGRTYTLEIVSDRGTYRSEPQTIVPTPPIDSVLLEFRELPSLDRDFPGSGIQVFSQWQDPPEDNYYFWRINGTYRIFTPDQVDRCCTFDPRDGLSEICWIVERNLRGSDVAFSDNMVNGELITHPVALIEDDGFRFNSSQLPRDKKYHVEVEQYLISEEDFAFFEKTEILATINGEIFDPPPLSVVGTSNIFNINDPDEIVIGRFGAYNVQKKGAFVTQSLLRFTQRLPSVCGDCRVRTGAQLNVPEPFLNRE